jgi:tetratricopeptide (TPR) repeat protein
MSTVWPGAPIADPTMACMTANPNAELVIRACRMALSQPGGPSVRHARLLQAEGEAHAALHHWRPAIDLYTRALADDPGEESLLGDRAAAQGAMRAYEAADADASAAIARHRADPANATNGSTDILANLYAVRGRIRLAAGHPSQALADFRRAETLFPSGVTPALKRLAARAIAQSRKGSP